MLTGEEITGHRQVRPLHRRPEPVRPRMVFDVKLLPHSYAVFAVETEQVEAQTSAHRKDEL